VDDVRSLLKVPGLFGAIVGKAVYEGRVDLKKAIALTGSK
jgi:phosphoribosylformimino-5-aminoimidazole carboxamide ribonucleotide (ProFAR) isomerase